LEARMRKVDGVVMVYPGQSLDGIHWYLDGRTPIHLSAADAAKLVLKTRAKRAHESMARLSGSLDNDWQGKGLTHEASNTWIPGGWEKLSWETSILFAVLSFIYGSIHGSSWNAHFPSMVEQMLWRAAVCSVAGGGFVISALMVMFVVLGALTVSPLEDWKSWITDGIKGGWGFLKIEEFGIFFLPALILMILAMIFLLLSTIIVGVTLIAITVAYLFSRAFLVVESFISIRSLPAGAYNTPSWVGYWPHIG